jgi:hypothetical protein
MRTSTLNCCILHIQLVRSLYGVPSSETSSRFWANLPMAAVVMGSLIWAVAAQRESTASGFKKSLAGSSWRDKRTADCPSEAWKTPAPNADGARWRDKVRAPVVEHAWENLCGSIIQEVRQSKYVALSFPQCLSYVLLIHNALT